MYGATDATYNKLGTWEPVRKQSNNCLITCHIKETQIKNQFDCWCIKSKKILVTMAYLPKGCAIILFIFNWFYFWKLQCLFPCNSAMLGGSPYKQPSHSRGCYLPINYRAALSHTGWALDQTLSEPLALQWGQTHWAVAAASREHRWHHYPYRLA